MISYIPSDGEYIAASIGTICVITIGVMVRNSIDSDHLPKKVTYTVSIICICIIIITGIFGETLGKINKDEQIAHETRQKEMTEQSIQKITLRKAEKLQQQAAAEAEYNRINGTTTKTIAKKVYNSNPNGYMYFFVADNNSTVEIDLGTYTNAQEDNHFAGHWTKQETGKLLP